MVCCGSAGKICYHILPCTSQPHLDLSSFESEFDDSWWPASLLPTQSGTAKVLIPKLLKD